jgi:hypothetical protein
MSAEQSQTQSAAQAGSSGEVAGVGPAVGVLRSSEEVPVMGMERRRDACSGVRRGQGRRPCEGISLCDEKSPTLTVVSAAHADMEPDSESRIREIRSSGLMRGECERLSDGNCGRQPLLSHSPTLPAATVPGIHRWQFRGPSGNLGPIDELNSTDLGI